MAKKIKKKPKKEIIEKAIEPKKEVITTLPETPKKLPIKKIIYITVLVAVLVSVLVYLITHPDLIKDIFKMLKETNITVPGITEPKPGVEINETQVTGLAAESMKDIKSQQDSLIKIQDLLSTLFK